MQRNFIVPAKLIVPLLASLLISGCGKEAKAPAPPPLVEAPASPQPHEQPTAAPITYPTVATDARLAESQAALKANDYEKAATALISLQQTRLNEQQAAAMTAQMKQLQGSLAGALASGDPRAKAAAAKLRQSTPR